MNYTPINVATVVICGIGLIGCITFMIAYHIRSDGHWWKTSDGHWNEIGIWLMSSRLNLAGIFALLICNRVAPDWPGRAELTLGLVALFALQTYWPGKLLWPKNGVTVDQRGGTSHDPR